MAHIVPAHSQKVTHSYIIAYPAHAPRAEDPHKHDFEEWKRRRRDSNTYYCDFAKMHRAGDTSECDLESPLEAHHKIIELATLNEVDLELLDADYPGISLDQIGAWIDSDSNLILLCVNHHRGPMGVHVASASDYGSSYYIRNLISKAT